MRINDRRQAGRTEEPARRDGLVEAVGPRKRARGRAGIGLVVLAAVLLLGSIAVLRTQTMEFQLVQPSLVPQSGNFFSMQFSNYPPLPNIDEFSGLDVYAIGDMPGWYWYDDRAVNYEVLRQQLQTEWALRQLQTQYGLTRASAEAVVGTGSGLPTAWAWIPRCQPLCPHTRIGLAICICKSVRSIQTRV